MQLIASRLAEKRRRYPADVVVQVEDEHWPGCSEDDPRARHHDDIGRVVPDERYHSRCHLWEGNVEHGEHEQPAR